jgi:hypothetical protein
MLMICPTLRMVGARKGDTHKKRKQPPRFLKELRFVASAASTFRLPKTRLRRGIWNSAQEQAQRQLEQGRAPKTGANLSTS